MMAGKFELDHKLLAGTALSVTTGVAIYSTYKLWRLKKKQHLNDVYESQKYLDEYLMFHFGRPDEVLSYDFGPKEAVGFPVKCADICMKYFAQASGSQKLPSRALDIGCAVGRSSFEMTKGFQEVVGIDYSHSFVNTCKALKIKGVLPYSVTTEGDLVQQLEAVVPPSLKRSKCQFMQGDACDLPTSLGQFGGVLAANLICRLLKPKQFFERMKTLVAAGGILVVTSPYTFSREYTPATTG